MSKSSGAELTVGAIDPGRLYTRDEACEVLRMERRTLRKFVALGRIMPTRWNGSNRPFFLGSEILKLIGLDAPPAMERGESDADRKARAQAATERRKRIG